MTMEVSRTLPRVYVPNTVHARTVTNALVIESTSAGGTPVNPVVSIIDLTWTSGHYRPPPRHTRWSRQSGAGRAQLPQELTPTPAVAYAPPGRTWSVRWCSVNHEARRRRRESFLISVEILAVLARKFKAQQVSEVKYRARLFRENNWAPLFARANEPPPPRTLRGNDARSALESSDTRAAKAASTALALGSVKKASQALNSPALSPPPRADEAAATFRKASM